MIPRPRRMRNILLAGCLWACGFQPSAAVAEQKKDAGLIAELKAHTQELFDAVVSGKKEPWQKYFADDCIFADEKGRLFNKTQLVADITPLPSGYSGQIRLGEAESRVLG